MSAKFEPHTDIIVKDRRAVHYGHKLNLTSGRSGLIFDIVIEAGNPADAERFMPMLERHIDTFGRVPRQVAADGGYASKDNLAAARQAGVEDLAFHKNAGLKSRTWHTVRGCIANCATSAPGSKPGFRA